MAFDYITMRLNPVWCFMSAIAELRNVIAFKIYIEVIKKCITLMKNFDHESNIYQHCHDGIV